MLRALHMEARIWVTDSAIKLTYHGAAVKAAAREDL